MPYILKWGVLLDISANDIDIISKGLTAPCVPPPSEIDRLESVYHLGHMIYLDQMVEDSELEVASIYASRLDFPNSMVADLFKPIARVEFDRTSLENVRKEVIDSIKLQKSQTFIPNYALGMHSLPGGLTNTDGTVSIVKVKP